MILRLRAGHGVLVIGALVGLAVAGGCSGSAFEADDEGGAGQAGSDGSSGGSMGGSGTTGGSGGSSGVSGGGGEGDAGSSGVCDELVCENAGECVITANGSARCDCAVGFSGERCETNIDDCAPNPCENGGTCRDLLDAFRCECPPGFAGETCGDAGDVCEPNPCQNGAMCLATADGYHCDCAEGFTGDDCGTNVDDCASNPCENGTCHDGIDAFVCECDEGYAGDRCEFRINGCDPDPCRNGGVCSANGTDVTCDCTPGFTGTLCEQTRYIDVLAGETHSCALAGDGVVTCWGNNMWGQTDVPADLLDSISDGAVLNSCGMAGETAICWGWNSALPGEALYRSISGGAWDANCYVTTDGGIGCWGGNADITDGVLGDKDYAAVSLGFYFGCGLTTGGGVRCWGSDAYGQIANTPRSAGFEAMDAGYWRACGIRDGALSCWGLPPGELPTGTFSALSVGIEHGCAIRTDGTVACWESPAHDDGRAIPPDGEFLVVSAGGGHTCGVTIENSVVCWGNNDFGQSDSTPGF